MRSASSSGCGRRGMRSFSSTTSVNPPSLAAISGLPAAMASRATMPNGSLTGANTTAKARENRICTSRLFNPCRKNTRFDRPKPAAVRIEFFLVGTIADNVELRVVDVLHGLNDQLDALVRPELSDGQEDVFIGGLENEVVDVDARIDDVADLGVVDPFQVAGRVTAVGHDPIRLAELVEHVH